MGQQFMLHPDVPASPAGVVLPPSTFCPLKGSPSQQWASRQFSRHCTTARLGQARPLLPACSPKVLLSLLLLLAHPPAQLLEESNSSVSIPALQAGPSLCLPGPQGSPCPPQDLKQIKPSTKFP